MAGNGQNKANNEGVNMLARVMQERMQKISYTPEPLEFGEIQGDYSLLTNKFPIPIPKSDYLVCRLLMTDPNKLIPGDHVLVAWIGSDPVVIDVIRTGKELG